MDSPLVIISGRHVKVLFKTVWEHCSNINIIIINSNKVKKMHKLLNCVIQILPSALLIIGLQTTFQLYSIQLRKCS